MKNLIRKIREHFEWKLTKWLGWELVPKIRLTLQHNKIFLPSRIRWSRTGSNAPQKFISSQISLLFTKYQKVILKNALKEGDIKELDMNIITGVLLIPLFYFFLGGTRPGIYGHFKWPRRFKRGSSHCIRGALYRQTCHHFNMNMFKDWKLFKIKMVIDSDLTRSFCILCRKYFFKVFLKS